MNERRPVDEETEIGLTEPSIIRDLAGDEPMVILGDPAAIETPPELQLGAHKYRILDELGIGGMGRVYLAFDQDLGRNVALKMMRVQSAAGARRFLEEARVMGQLDHPNIVPVYDVGIARGGRFYYTMRVVRGRTLATLLEECRGSEAARKEYSFARLVQMFLQMGQGVAFAHAKGVVHRDIKPSNIMIGEHGEVLVLDWGLSHLTVPAAGKRSVAAGSRIAGTPRYMAPEQARGEEIDERVDVYALGAVLYEMLTLRPMFESETQETLLDAVRERAPVPPRKAAPERAIPRELETICLRAIASSCDERTPSVQKLMSEARTWLEAEADRERRHQLAQSIAEEGRRLLAEYFSLQERLTRLEAVAEEVRRGFEGWQPAHEKTSIIEAEDRVAKARTELAEAASSVVGTLDRALEFDRENAVAREALADYYWDRFRAAERSGRDEDLAFFSRRIREYDDGKYTQELEGTGSLALEVEPPEASAVLHRIESDGFVHVPAEGRPLEVSRRAGYPLGMGSYLVVLRQDGFHETRYPVHIARNTAWRGRVRLRREGTIPPGFIHVPGGPFAAGGDPVARRANPGSVETIGDFLVARMPVTMEEYLEFLNELAGREGIDAARARSPRRSALDPVTAYLDVDADGRLQLPETDSEGDEWDPRLPAVAVSWNDAVTYAEWLSARDARRYRLPTELEWEKAARGVDGRWFPWGWRFDPSLCNMEESRRERPAPVPVDEFPGDVSIYGVRGCAGNVEEWTATEIVEGSGSSARVGKIVRGGGWNSRRPYVRCAARYDYAPETSSDFVGFRLVCELDD